MFQIARIIGKILRDVLSEYSVDGQTGDNPYSSTFILGGKLVMNINYLIYPEGNFIEASDDQPFSRLVKKVWQTYFSKGFDVDLTEMQLNIISIF